jgi:hypothetical protein
MEQDDIQSSTILLRPICSIRLGQDGRFIMNMDELDLQVYHGYRDALSKLKGRFEYLARKPHLMKYLGTLPVILVDYKAWEVHYFEDESRAQSHLDENHTHWDEEPPNGDDDELVIFKFFNEGHMENFIHSAKDYKFYREVEGHKFYRCKTMVQFEPELIINVSF